MDATESVSLPAKKTKIHKPDDKARQIPIGKEEQNFNTDSKQPGKKYEVL